MAGTFPYMGSWGYTEKHTAQALLRMYPDKTYRRYLRYPNIHRLLTLQFKAFPEAKKDAIKAFWDARMVETTQAGFEFLCYNPEETLVMTGTTGRYNAIFDGNEITFTNVNRCRWNFSVGIILLNPA